MNPKSGTDPIYFLMRVAMAVLMGASASARAAYDADEIVLGATEKAVKAAQEAGFGKPENIHSVRVEGGDKPGLGAKIARTLGDAGINFRGVSAVAIGTKFISYIACDNAEDAARAIAALKKLK